VKLAASVGGDWESGLAKLEAAVSESVLRDVAYTGADILRDEAQARAPVRSGVLRANVIVKHLDEEAEEGKRQSYKVTVRSGKFNAEGDAFYWRWVEFGTSKMAARPFMRPAYEAKVAEAVEKMQVRFNLRMEAAL
jgi:HK97 gp10 family phage protein